MDRKKNKKRLEYSFNNEYDFRNECFKIMRDMPLLTIKSKLTGEILEGFISQVCQVGDLCWVEIFTKYGIECHDLKSILSYRLKNITFRWPKYKQLKMNL